MISPLVTIQSLKKSFGSQVLFEDLNFSIFPCERIGLIGPNGSGKSTLLKILMQLEREDEGEVIKTRGLNIGYAAQSPLFPEQSLEEILISQFPDSLNRARILLSKGEFEDPKMKVSRLSGGWKKRLDILRALMGEPDLLLLDEPTNHLDLEGIYWLEKFLKGERLSSLIVSHDRIFLERMTTKVIELGKCYPQGVFISEGNLTTFLQNKEIFLEAQIKEEDHLASTVRSEVEWLKKSPKARTVKSRARVERAQELIENLKALKTRNKKNKCLIEFTSSERETRKLIVAKNISKSYQEKWLFQELDILLSPGTRLGILGKNGTGKTTLMKILAQEIHHDSGTIKYADDLKLVYFDQHREALPGHITLRDALAPSGDFVDYRGAKIHIHGFAKRFLFSMDQLDRPLETFSGGERARVLMAKLMCRQADVLFLDEPTNDLDIETLEVIEESLLEFPGAIVLISHDRALLNKLCTQFIGLRSEKKYFSTYGEWENTLLEKKAKEEIVVPKTHRLKPKRLSYKEQKELEEMEGSVMACEEKIAELHSLVETGNASYEIYQKLSEAETHIENLYQRWQYLLNLK